MRVIYFVRATQLLVTLYALWMLYSVSAFCERTHHTMAACNDMITRIPMATPEEIAEHLRLKQLRAASNRPPVKNITSSSEPPMPTAHAAPSTESSTVPSSSEDVKKRVKREERRELPGNGMTETQRKAAAAETKKEEKMEVKKEEEKKKEGEKEVKKEEEKKNAVKVEETTPKTAHVKTDDKKEQPQEQKKEQNPAHPNTETKAEVKKEERKEKTVGTTTTATTAKSPKHQKEHLGAKVEIPVAPQMDQKDAKKTDGASKVIDHAPSTSGSDDKHHTVKKDLKAHVQEPAKVEATKESPATPPKLAPAQQRFVLEHSEAFLQEIRCLEVTSDAYFGKEGSPFAEHLKGLAFIGPILVFIAVYLVCTVLRARLSNENPTEFTEFLGGILHSAMWMIVGISVYFIANHWTDNWRTVSSNTFAPEFPCQWTNLAILASFMMVACSIETWFYKRLQCDIVFERSYRCYEVIDNSEAVAAGQNPVSNSRTNVY